MDNHEATQDIEKSTKKPSKSEEILGKMPSFFEHMKGRRTGHDSDNDVEMAECRAMKQNREFQEVYDLVVEQEDWEVAHKLVELNCARESPFLASGQSSYFNEQIDKDGMNGLKLRKEDVEDAQYIAECFGKEMSLSDDMLDIVYTTLPGTIEANYARQTFPAIIFEDVFQCSATHELPFPPKVGEKEDEYWLRVLSQRISETKDFPEDKTAEVKMRGMRLARNFCKGKNRIYLIPIKDVQDNKASFGDVIGLRGGAITDFSPENILRDKLSFRRLMDEQYCPDVRSMYQNPNFTSEYGVAIYGGIQSDDIEYVEIERAYDTMQREALRAGLKVGDDLILL